LKKPIFGTCWNTDNTQSGFYQMKRKFHFQVEDYKLGKINHIHSQLLHLQLHSSNNGKGKPEWSFNVSTKHLRIDLR